ncbi:hypothetical protein [Thermoanaerobacter kivui]|uniref:hypothetical protein n=1 Tax=Thermoanaerobacter kivui TaxID=2325 RepID=UPI000A76B30A|nr:hypothetical protein [Thermoanaerobacter kivui]
MGFKAMHQKGLTIVLTTHYVEEAEMLCERVGLMDKGSLITLGKPKELIGEIGRFVVEYFIEGRTIREFFSEREQAFERAESIKGNVNVRETNLEDAVLKLAGKF